VSSARDIVSITRLKSHAAELVREVTEEGRTLIVTQNGAAKVVVMDVGEFDRLHQCLAMLKMIAQGEADIVAGRVSTVDDAFAHALSGLEDG
jgi:prevent-host-death family protein